ncbi:MAG TPA: pyridoxamine 5'-phosphate oxidase family protein [Bacteroidetes bacterium]|nr:pyridoxamine 5'-phosphate oxidase family protein [Bacteroidota bacterium]
MAKQLPRLTPELETFIANQKVFFVGTAMREGRVNISPKGMDSFRILSPNRIVWLNLTGSGNETATHLMESDRMTIMFCAFEGKPLILRLYGTTRVYHERDAEFHEHLKRFPALAGSRQIMDMEVDLVQTSCGFAVPFMDFKEERSTLITVTEKLGDGGVENYWKEKNTISLDGHPTNIF